MSSVFWTEKKKGVAYWLRRGRSNFSDNYGLIGIGAFHE